MSFGSVIGAIVSLKNNKRSRTSKTEKFFKTTGAKFNAVKSHTHLTPEELKLLRKKIRTENNYRNRKTGIITAVILLIFVAFIYYLLFVNKDFFNF